MTALTKTSIPYATHSWGIVTGCTKVSPACDNCWAARLAATRLRKHPRYKGLATCCEWYPGVTWEWTGEVRFHADLLDAPLHRRDPAVVFVAPFGDLFHEAVTNEQLDQAFSVMARTPRITYLIVTKRMERLQDYMLGCQRGADDIGGRFPWPNVWLIPSIWDQVSADRVIPLLLDTPAAVRGVSLEPMLGAVEFNHHQLGACNCYDEGNPHPSLDLVILGGESGAGARPMRPEWALSVYRQCKAAGVPFCFKQWSAAPWTPAEDAYAREHATELLEMVQSCEWPEVTR